jgi:dihydrofolate reductase
VSRLHVVSSTLQVEDPDVDVVADPVALVRMMKQREGLGIWLAGGGTLAAALRDEIDELVIKRNPIVTGSGIALFQGTFRRYSFVPTGRGSSTAVCVPQGSSLIGRAARGRRCTHRRASDIRRRNIS